MFGVHVYVCSYACLIQKQPLSNSFQNSTFFNKYERILYNKMHNDNVYFQNANSPDRKKSVLQFST